MKEQITSTQDGEKLMIDNLWKILASEKASGGPSTEMAQH